MKTKETKKQFTCSICKDTFEGFGNNAQPVNNGECCDKCNLIVVTQRILFMNPSNPNKNV